MRPRSDREETLALLMATHELREREVRGGRSDRVVEDARQRVFRLATAVQAHVRRYNLTLANPLFSCPTTEVTTNQVFFAGRDELREALAGLCSRRGLVLADAPAPGAIPQETWQRLRRSGVAVVDVGSSDPVLLADAYYQLGLASAFGVPTAVLAEPERGLPLRPEHPLVWLIDSEALGGLMDQALELAFCQPGRVDPDGQLTETTAELERRIAGVPRRERVERALSAARQAGADANPRALREAVEILRGEMPAGRRLLTLSPNYAPSYPKGQRRLLHLVPSEGLPSQATGAVEAGCVSRGIRYVRGPRRAVLDAPSAIWRDVGPATVVVADLTGLDPVVAFAVALAHVRGKSTLLVASTVCSDTTARVFPSIATLPIEPWADGAALHALVTAHLAAA